MLACSSPRGADRRLFVEIPKGFFPQQDTGLIIGVSEAAQDVSPQEMMRLMRASAEVVLRDPDVAGVGSTIGSRRQRQTPNTGRFFIALKPRDERGATASQIIDRLRPQLAKRPGREPVLQAAQDITVGGRISRGQFQYTLQDADVDELNHVGAEDAGEAATLPQLADVATDQQANAPQLTVTINRDQAARFGIQPQVIDDTLNDAFGQRQVAQYFTQINTYNVVLEVAARAAGQRPRRSTRSTSKSPVTGAAGAALDARHWIDGTQSARSRSPSGSVPGGDASFNLRAGRRARPGGRRDPRRRSEIGMPPSLIGTFQGNAQAFQHSLASEPADRARRWWWSTSSWACSTRATSTR